MTIELLVLAREVLRNLYEFKRLRMQTLLFLRMLEPSELRDIQIYFYPLWKEKPSGSEYNTDPVLNKESKTVIELINELESLAQNPIQMELLSAGVGFIEDLGWSDLDQILQAAALGGAVEVLEHLQYREYYTNPYKVAIWATVGGHLHLVKDAYSEDTRIALNLMMQLAAKYDRLPVLKWVADRLVRPLQKVVIEKCLKFCCYNRNFDMLVFLLGLYPVEAAIYQTLLIEAVGVPNQNLQLMKLLLDHVPEAQLDFKIPGSRQPIPVLELLLDRGAITLEPTLIEATWRNTDEVVAFLAARGASIVPKAVEVALRNDRFELAWSLIGPADNLNDFLVAAVQANNLDVARQLIQRGATDLNRALMAAIEMQDKNFITFLIDQGADNLDRALLHAVSLDENSNQSVNITKLLVSRGASNLNEALLENIKVMSHRFGGYVRWKVALALINLGADNFDEALELAQELYHELQTKDPRLRYIGHFGFNKLINILLDKTNPM